MLYLQTLFLFAASLSLTLSSPIISSPQETPAPQVRKRAPSSWVHPGVLNSKAQLDFVKAQVASDVFSTPRRNTKTWLTNSEIRRCTAVEQGVLSTPE